MKRFLIALAGMVFLIGDASRPAVVAQKRDCSVSVTLVESGHTVYEIAGQGFSPGEQVRIEAVNRRTSQGFVFFVIPPSTSFSGLLIGKDPDGFFCRVPPGGWKVEAKGGGCKAKTDFTVSGVPNGVWGGDQVRLEISEKGATLLAFCASGTIDEPLVPDLNGKFEARGTLILQAGPSVKFEKAHYTGQTDGQTMTLTVTVEDNDGIRRTFTVMFGQEVLIRECPIV